MYVALVVDQFRRLVVVNNKIGAPVHVLPLRPPEKLDASYITCVLSAWHVCEFFREADFY